MMTPRHKTRAIFPLLACILFCMTAFAHTPANGSSITDELNTTIWYTGGRWVAAENPVSQLPAEQKASLVSTIHPSRLLASTLEAPQTLSAPLNIATPATLDWRNYNGKNYVTSVRNQGKCGDCWAFATAAALESQVLITEGLNLDLSEQALLTCSGAGDCTGGHIETASDYIRDAGLPIETCLPYTAVKTTCSLNCDSSQSAFYRISGWEHVTTASPDLNTLKSALFADGPLVTTMAVYQDFYYYKQGIYTHTSGSFVGYHGTLIVGYDDNAQCFIAKDSWGTGWGESGFFRIAYSEMTGDSQFGQYTIAYHRSGNLWVDIKPQDAVTAGAEWRVDDGSWRISGTAASNLAVGQHIIQFNEVSGWIAPVTQLVTVVLNDAHALTGTFTAPIVFTSPNISAAGISQANQYSQSSSQSTAENAQSQDSVSRSGSGAPASASLDNADRQGTLPPATNVVSREEAQTAGTAQQNPPVAEGVAPTQPAAPTGSPTTSQPDLLRVNISPREAVSAGAQWRIAGREWNNADTVPKNLASGNYTIEFKPMPGWKAPDSQVVSIQRPQTARVSGTYKAPSGMLKVALAPSDAVSAGALWKVDSGQWHKNGESIPLDPGSHTVSYQDVPGWTNPGGKPVSIQSTQETKIEADYSLPKIAVLYPSDQAKIKAGASQTIRWNFTGNIGQFVKIELVKDNVGHVLAEKASAGESGAGACRITFPKQVKQDKGYRIRIVCRSNGLVFAESHDFAFVRHK